MTRKLVIRAVSGWNHPNLRTWEPEDPSRVAEVVTLTIGLQGEKSADRFELRVATPSGLVDLSDQNGILATRPLLVMRQYKYDDLWRWLEETVARCEGDCWTECAERLCRYFRWEFEDYSER